MDFGLSNAWPFLFSAVFLILLKLAYRCLGLTICRHPLAAGTVLWLVTGDLNLLFAAVFFELLWLDLFYVGTYVPPDNLFAYLLFAPLVTVLGLSQPQDICVIMLACLPFAALFGKIEARMRLRESASYKRMNQVIDARDDIETAISGIIRRSLLRFAILCFTVYSLSAMLLSGASMLWIWEFGAIYRIKWAGWGFLLCLAALGALLALRITWARVCFAACVLVIGGLYVF